MAENDFAMGYAMGQDSGGGGSSGGGGGFWGGDGVWGFLILALLFGGGRGFGGGGGGGFMGGGGCECQTAISNGFALNGLENGIRGIQNGLCDGFYSLNTSLLTGFNGLQAQSAQCCCETQRLIERGFCDLGNHINTSTRDIIESQNAGVRSILDFLVQDKISSLQAENQTLRFRASQAEQNAFITANQEAQTAELIRRIAPTPVPSYTVPAPYPYGYSGYGGGGCGCGCGCGCG